MAGIYIHIPFCKQACSYCNFHFSTSKTYIPQLINCIASEAVLRKNEMVETVDTIYFGGGTPSIIETYQLNIILQKIRDNYLVNPEAEITIEANPDDITETKLLELKEIGVNRFSLGIQSFIDEELVWMNRTHNSNQAIKSIELIKKHFNNYSIDLIFGSQKLTNEQWQKNIEQALTFRPPHLSCYALTVEEKTVLGKKVEQKIIADTDSNKQAEQFEILMNALSTAGYHHYEISNYALPGFESKHNSSYWQGKNYLGLGPSAHSYNGLSRYWNIANNSLYMNSIEKGALNFESELLTAEQKFNEYIMISLRTSKGVDLEFVEKNWNVETDQHVSQKIQKWLKINHLKIINQHLQLTKKGKLFADGIAADFFL